MGCLNAKTSKSYPISANVARIQPLVPEDNYSNRDLMQNYEIPSLSQMTQKISGKMAAKNAR